MEADLCRHDSLLMHRHCVIWQLIGLSASTPVLDALRGAALLITALVQHLFRAADRCVNPAYLGLMAEHRGDSRALVHV